MGNLVKVTWEYYDVDRCYLGWSPGPGSFNMITNIADISARSYDWTVNVGNMLSGSEKLVKLDILCYKIGVGNMQDLSDDFFTVFKP